MKTAKLVLFLVLVGVTGPASFAQQRFESTAPTLKKEKKEKLDQSLRKYEVFTIDYRNINELAKSKKKDIPLTLSINEVYEWSMLLEENDMRSPEYRSVITTDKGDIIQERGECHTYKGFVVGDSSEYVRLTINADGLEGYIKQHDDFVLIQSMKDFLKEAESEKKGTDVHQEDEPTDGLFVAYNQEDVISKGEGGCGVTKAMEDAYLERVKNGKTNHSSSRLANFNFNIVDMATEADGEWFAIHGANSNAQILTVLNQIEGVYWNTFQTRIFVTFQHVFNNAATDPFTVAANDGLGLINQLRTEWQNNRAGVERDMVHLFSGRAVNVGGNFLWGRVAGLGTVCSDPANAYAFSKHYAFTFFTTAHEIGHLFSAEHDEGGICGTLNRTIMCQGETTNNFVFSAASQNAIRSFMSNNICINGSLSLVSGTNHNRICSDRTTRFLLTRATKAPATVNWQAGGSLVVRGGTNLYVDVRSNSSSTSLGWIQATVTSTVTNDQYVIRRDNIPTGPELRTPTLYGPSCVRQGQSEQFYVNEFTTNYNWTAYDGIITSGQNSRIAYIRPTTSNGMYITVSATGGGECGGPNGFASNYYSDCNGFNSLTQQITAFPNPTSGMLHIQTEGDFQITEMTVMDESARVSKHVILQDNEANVDLSDLKPGLYFIKFMLDGRERVERILIE